MNRKSTQMLVTASALVAAATGCQQPQRGVMRQIPDPLIGARPLPAPDKDEKPFDLPKVELPRREEQDWIPRGGISNRWQCIVIHHSASDRDTPQGMADWHVRRGWDELGYHFVIGNGVRYPDGRIFVGSRWPKQKTGAHCKVPGNYYNEHGIGICLIGNFNHRQPSPAQMESLARLVSFLMREARIPSDRIFTHGGVTRKTECPGRHFSLATLRQRLARQPIAAYSD